MVHSTAFINLTGDILRLWFIRNFNVAFQGAVELTSFNDNQWLRIYPRTENINNCKLSSHGDRVFLKGWQFIRKQKR